MKSSELHEILDDKNRKLTLDELKQVIYELKQDCHNETYKLLEEYDNWGCEQKDYIRDNSFYNGEINAFQIVLDLLKHLVGQTASES